MSAIASGCHRSAPPFARARSAPQHLERPRPRNAGAVAPRSFAGKSKTWRSRLLPCRCRAAGRRGRGGGPAHRRDVDEVEGVGFLDLQQLTVVRELFVVRLACSSVYRAAGRFPSRLAWSCLTIDTNEPAGAGPHHQHVIEPGRAFREREVATIRSTYASRSFSCDSTP